MYHITVDVCTKDRYETTLPLTLLSIANQTRKPDLVLIYDDSSNPRDMRTIESLSYVLRLLLIKEIPWEVISGYRRGQHIGHQIIQDRAKDLIWRIDDDEVAEPNTLEILLSEIEKDETIGAVGGLVLMPGTKEEFCKPNKILDVLQNKSYNCQWHPWKNKDEIVEVEHLYSSYLYKKGLSRYELNLSPVAHREETLHSYGIFKGGKKLIVTSKTTTWHFRASTGGIRTGGQEDWYRDERTFHEIMREYDGRIVCYLDSGKGDHLVFKKAVLPKIKEKYKEVTLAVCWSDVFEGEKTISIAEGQKMCNPDRHNISKFMIDNNWKDELKYAYAALYKVEI